MRNTIVSMFVGLINLLISLITADELSTPFNGKAIISFDEGPSKNIPKILEILEFLDVKATFHLDPIKIKNNDIVNKIVSSGHCIGLSVTEDFTDMEDDEVKQHLISLKEDFVKKTGYKSRFIRLPRTRYTNEHVLIAESLDLIVTRPNLDSEDIDIEDFTIPFEEYIQRSNPRNSSLSICFRDRMGHTVRNLNRVLRILMRKGYEIVSFGEFYGCDDKPIKEDQLKTSESTNIDTKMPLDNNLGEKAAKPKDADEENGVEEETNPKNSEQNQISKNRDSTELKNTEKDSDNMRKEKLECILNGNVGIKAKKNDRNDNRNREMNEDEDENEDVNDGNEEDVPETKEKFKKKIKKDERNLEKDIKKIEKDSRNSWGRGQDFNILLFVIPLLFI